MPEVREFLETQSLEQTRTGCAKGAPSEDYTTPWYAAPRSPAPWLKFIGLGLDVRDAVCHDFTAGKAAGNALCTPKEGVGRVATGLVVVVGVSWLVSSRNARNNLRATVEKQNRRAPRGCPGLQKPPCLPRRLIPSLAFTRARERAWMSLTP